MLELNNVRVGAPASALDAAARRAAAWLMESGAQIQSADASIDGGFVSWYDAETQSYPYVYSEITGYALTMLTVMHRRTGEAKYLDRAVQAARWLMRTAHSGTGGFRCLVPLHTSRFDYKVDQIYTFDCGVILSGLVNVYRATQLPDVLAAAVRVADWLVGPAQKARGFQPMYEITPSGGAFVESDAEWSLSAGSYHTKIAIGLLNLFDVVKEPRYLSGVTNACDYALTFQEENGRFATFPAGRGTNSHPHAYSAEGLWVVGSVLGRRDYLDASAAATGWLLDMQSPEGVIPRHYHNGAALYNERVDVLSQALRLAVIHRADGRISRDIQPNLDSLIALILRNQLASDDRRIDGGFSFGRLSDGTVMPHVNVWVTMFALQALNAYADAQSGRLDFPFFEMV